MKKTTIIIIIACIVSLMVPTSVFGTINTIPNSSTMVSASTVLKMNESNYSAKWTGVAGKLATNSLGCKSLMVPIKSTTSAWSYTDFLDVTFTNAGNIAGRSVDVKVHYNSMTVEAAYSTNGMRDDNYMSVMELWGTRPSINGTTTYGVGYRAVTVYDITTTVVWSDTGSVVDLPFFIAASDIDAGGANYTEGWEAVSGFTGEFYIYKENVMNISGNKFMSSKSGTTDGIDCYLKTGVYAPTKKGQFRAKYYEGDCGTFLEIFNQYDILKAPVKAIKNTDTVGAVNSYVYEEGDPVTFEITQKIGTFYQDTMSVYPSLTMTDTIPAGLEYVSGSVTDSTGVNHGSVTYNSDTRMVSFSLSSEWLASEASYKGQTLIMTINCKATEPRTTADIIKNIAYTNISTLSYASNTVSLSVVKPDLVISKASDKEEYHSGETSRWTIAVQQPIANATAENVIIKDEELPEGLVIDMDTVKADDSTAAIEKDGNSFKVTVPELAGEKSVNISFDATFDPEKLVGSSLKNTATAESSTKSTKIYKSATKEISLKNSITTKINNGTITESMEGIEIGDERDIEYTPDDGYYIQKILVDGKEMDVEVYKEGYTFGNIRENHEIVVKCAPIPDLAVTKETSAAVISSEETIEYSIKTTQTVAGAVAENVEITDAKLPDGLVIDMDTIRVNDDTATIKKGDNEFTVYVPEIDEEKEVEITFNADIDAEKIENGVVNNRVVARSLTGGEEIIAEDEHEIEVLNRITTKVENGAITDSIEDICIGETKTIEYSPDEGYYLQKIIVDGEAVPHEKHNASFTFKEVKKNHSIEVTYAPVPVSNENDDNADIVEDANTGDSFNPFYFMVIAGNAAIVVFVILLSSRIRKESEE